MKFKKNIIEIMRSRVAVNCDSEEKAEALLKELEEHGIRWGSGKSLFSFRSWGQYEHKTCYVLDYIYDPPALSYCGYDFFEKKGYKIIKFEELLEDEQENDNNNYDNLAIKVNDIIHDLIDYADKKCENTIHTAEAYKDGYIKGCKDSLGEVRAILSEFNNN